MSLTANINRNSKVQPTPFSATDFLAWWEQSAAAGVNAPIDLGDAKAQSDLIKAAMFGRTKGNST
jgi:hypothetical protein